MGLVLTMKVLCVVVAFVVVGLVVVVGRLVDIVVVDGLDVVVT